MKYYDRLEVQGRIKFIMSEEWKPHPNYPAQTREDALLEMADTISETCYRIGQMNIQERLRDTIGIGRFL